MKNFKYLMLLMVFFGFNRAGAQNTTSAINNVLQSYLAVKEALVNSNISSANTNAKSLVTYLGDIIPAKLSANEKKAWTTYSEKLRYNAQHISETRTIDNQREQFAALSDALYGLLRTFKTRPTIYRQYCPMKKQYWLNASKEIQNPYYGKSMLDCGKVTETMTGAASAIMLD